jgi:hypothetical protein
MEKTKHLFNEAVYLISNKTVARNPLFCNKQLCRRFLMKIDQFLSPLCDILAYSIDNTEFQLIVKLHSRSVFCEFYKQRTPDKEILDNEIPLSTYIFSKAVSDLLVSTVKHFNYHHGRSGALFMRRYFRRLIESEKELTREIERLNRMKRLRTFQNPWNILPKGYRLNKKRQSLKEEKTRSTALFFDQKLRRHELLSKYIFYLDFDLRGCFKKLPPKSIYSLQGDRPSLNYYLNSENSS